MAISRVTIVGGDVTTHSVGAVVNAANPTCYGSAGVAGAWVLACPEQVTLTGHLPVTEEGIRCPVGDARSFRLSDGRLFVHAVGPIFPRGRPPVYPGEYQETDERTAIRVLQKTLEAVFREAQGEPQVALVAVSCGFYGATPEAFVEALRAVQTDYAGEVLLYALPKDLQALKRAFRVLFRRERSVGSPGGLRGSLRDPE